MKTPWFSIVSDGAVDKVELHRPPWTNASVRRLIEMHKDTDLSMTDMASQLGKEFQISLTRNSIVGKLHRLKLTGPTNTRAVVNVGPHRAGPRPRKGKGRLMEAAHSVPGPVQARRKPVEVPVDAPIGLPTFEEATAQEGQLTIYQLSEKTCRWPLGPVQARPPFFYCGKVTTDDRYCTEHCRLSHREALPRKAAHWRSK